MSTNISPVLFFSITILIWHFLISLGKNYALDLPDDRKNHKSQIPQIGGIIFGSMLLFTAWFFNLVPIWYLYCSLLSMLLGAADDIIKVPWQIKLFFQIGMLVYISNIFWGQISIITFYDYTFDVNPFTFLIVSIFWFIGVYNAINLLDGLDGLASGIVILMCMGYSLIAGDISSHLNIILVILLLGFMVFNQRPAIIFMGDAGSLFLGFHIAVLPLLYFDNTNQSFSIFNATPFVLIISYLIADTSRVFFTRIVAKKNPMTADTIHFHHLILQQSSSYLSSIGIIYFITLSSVIASIFSFYIELSINFMLIHFGLLLLFILTPPVQTYVPIIGKIVKPFYKWQKNRNISKPFFPRTFFMLILVFSLAISLIFNDNLLNNFNFYHGVSFILLSIFSLFNKKNIFSMYSILIGFSLLFCELFWFGSFDISTKLLTTIIFVFYIISTFQKRYGCDLREFSALDLILCACCFGGIILSFVDAYNSIWFSLILFVLWFGISFILRRSSFLIKRN